MTAHHEELETAGAWVLGALDDGETTAFADHLRSCGTCRDEVARLRVVAAALPLAAPQVGPPPELRSRIMAIVEREAELLRAAGPDADRAPTSSRRGFWAGLLARPQLAAAGAMALLAAGALTGFLVRGDSSVEAPVTRSVVADNGAVGMLVIRDGDAKLVVAKMQRLPAGRVYQVWLKRHGQSPQPDAVFAVDRAGRGSVAVRGELEGVDAVLVTSEPDGGSVLPTRDPVMRVPRAA